MHASFSTQEYGDEASSAAAVQAGQTPAEGEHVYGTVTLSRPDGAALAVTDDLLFLMPDLCKAALAGLAQEGQAAVTMVDYPNTLRLVRDGADVQLSDSLGGALTVPYDELVPALRDCGVRFAAYLEALSALQAGIDWAARDLRATLGPLTPG